MSLGASHRLGTRPGPSVHGPSASDAGPLWAPLRDGTFRTLWVANAASNVGSWMQVMAAAWLMATMTDSAAMVAAVQLAATLPVFALALPAGVLADRFDRWSILYATQGAMAATAFLMSVLASMGWMTPTLLVLGTAAIGCGTAVSMPAWQAGVATLVRPGEIHRAAVLNGMSFNVARAAGPALAGILAQSAGISTVFWLNAASFLGLVHASRGRRSEEARDRSGLGPGFAAAMVEGLSTVAVVPAFRSLLARTFACFFGASCLWSLLPAYAAFRMGADAWRVGWLMGLVGAGAVCGGFILPRLKAAVGANLVVCAASLLLAGSLAALACSPTLPVACPALVCAGFGWCLCVSTLNGCAQAMFPSRVRARAVSTYLLSMYGGSAAGSLAWGGAVTWFDLRSSFAIAATVLGGSALMAAKWPVD